MKLCKSRTHKCEKCSTVYNLVDLEKHLKECENIQKTIKRCAACNDRLNENQWNKLGDLYFCQYCFEDHSLMESF